MSTMSLRAQIVLVLAYLIPGVVQAIGLPAPVSDSDYHYNGQPEDAKVELGQALFFDKILSGNRDISCGTCHHPTLASGDSLSLPVGAGGRGLGLMRTTGTGATAIKGRIGRNSSPLWNLGAKQFINIGWAGRHIANPNDITRLSLACGRSCPAGLENVLAGQSLFPLQNTGEMIGNDTAANEFYEAIFQPQNNTPAKRQVAGWEAIMVRLRAINGYFALFQSAYPTVTSPSQMTITQYANAIAAFETVAFRSDNSPFDRHLRGDANAMSASQIRGMDLFYNGANCASCHAGAFQTDHRFYGIAMPQFGPGAKSAGTLAQEDLGHHEVAQGNQGERYAFRTQPLRNVVFTAPYGHTGAYIDLEGIIRHHLDPVNSLQNYDRTQAVLTSRSDLDAKDFLLLDDPNKVQSIINANDLQPRVLTDDQVSDLVSFMDALTDPDSLDIAHWIPATVPSGLPVAD